VALSLRLASEAALPARNFNDATRDRRFFPRLAVPLFRNATGQRAREFHLCNALSAPSSSLRTRPATRSAFGKDGPRFGVGIRSFYR